MDSNCKENKRPCPGVGKMDIWRDTDEERLRREWKDVVRVYRTVRQEMDGYRPKSRDSARRMKYNINQIRLDISRTWGTHSAYSTEMGRNCLERVLVSWVAYNPRIGYVQSMSFVSAMILAVCKGDEDDALSIFKTLMEDTSFGDYFHQDKDFQALHDDTKKLQLLLLEEDIILAQHFEKIGFELGSVTPSWLLTCFFQQTHPAEAIGILDMVMKCGRGARKCLIYHAVTLLIEKRSKLLQCHDLESIYCILKKRNTES